MSIQSEITRISGNVSDSLDAVAAKGVTVPANATSDDLPSLIRSIPQGSSGSPMHTIYIEYDNTNSVWVVTQSDFDYMSEIIAAASGSNNFEDVRLFKVISEFDSSTTPPTEAECEVYSLVKAYTISEASGGEYTYCGRLTFTSILKGTGTRRVYKTVNMYCEMDSALDNAGFTFTEDNIIDASVSGEVLSL